MRTTRETAIRTFMVPPMTIIPERKPFTPTYYMNISKAILRKLSESGYFKGKLKEAYMRKSWHKEDVD
jgi:hypothetical protein